ncbi:hypothetical protein FOLKNPGA_02273 [Legionella sp. PC1000]|nr:hypothetical protein FOLKNPGA_02273 [Legionella sp. PC1000]
MVSFDINYNKINGLFLNQRTENPRVRSSILPLATHESQRLTRDFKISM